MYIIGITGGTGSGKTIALRVMEKLGALALDCDEIYHELLDESQTMLTEIKHHFPIAIDNEVESQTTINRIRLSQIVFNDKQALQKLNDITHKYVINEVKIRISEWERQGGTIAAVDAIALLESGTKGLCNKTIGIIAPIETRIQRIMSRDGITQEQAELRVNAQKPDSFFIENCDEIIENNYPAPEEFEEKCKATFTEIINNIT